MTHQDASLARSTSLQHSAISNPQSKRWWLAALATLLFVALVGPWPTWDRPLGGSERYRASIQAIRAAAAPSGPAGPLRAGAGAAAIPLGNAPIGGWPRRQLFATQRGNGEPLQTRALVLDDGAHTLTLVAAELLLITPAIAQATVDALAAQGAPGDRAWIYFGATHTHSGPSGLGSSAIERVMLGAYRRDFVEMVGRQIAAAIQQARRTLVPAEVGYAAIPVPGPLGNRLMEGAPIDPHLDVLAVREPGGRPLALVLAYAAHPTTLGGEDRSFSGDYPGALVRRMEEQTGARTLFLAGAVGSTTVVREDLRGPQGPDRLGDLLANAALAALPGIAYRGQARLAALRIPIALPRPQVRLAGGLALSPILPSLLLPREASLHVVAVNELVLAGIPGEFSGEESLRLRERWRERGIRTVATSLNGEYVGYILPDARYGTWEYETRWGAMYGPHLGSYLRAGLDEAIARVNQP